QSAKQARDRSAIEIVMRIRTSIRAELLSIRTGSLPLSFNRSNADPPGRFPKHTPHLHRVQSPASGPRRAACFGHRRLCYTFRRMGDNNESVLDKAEQLARRVLERLGSTVDSKLGSGGDEALSHREVSALTARIEREIDAN